MFQLVDTKDTPAVQQTVQDIYQQLFPHGDATFVTTAFGWALDCFQGRYRDYQPIDARYHDLEHTMQGTLCMMRLLKGYQAAKAEPALNQKIFELGLLAILMHDTGYLKHRGDNDGTGAKYTLIHVGRSADFAQQLLTEKGFDAADIVSVRHMIRCTGVNIDLNVLAFTSDLARKVGFALGSADLLGQMAADDYVEKLPILFSEFAESARHSGGSMAAVGNFASADDLMRKTPGFWEKYVLPKLTHNFEGVYRFLNDPYPDGLNYYLKRIEANIAKLRQQLANLPV